MTALPARRSLLGIGPGGTVAVTDGPMPEPGPGMVLVRVRASLVSPGTELGPWQGKTRTREPGETLRPFGYQNAGDVVAQGPGCEGIAIGQRVACMGASYALHAEYACVPLHLTIPLPDSVEYQDAAFAALVPTAMHAVRRGEITFGQEVGVFGLGLVGALCAQVATLAGARVSGFDPLPMRSAMARATGVEGAAALEGDAAVERIREVTGGRGLDAAILALTHNATAALETASRAMHMAPDTHRYGPIVLVGGAEITHRFGADLGNLDLRSAARTGPGYHDKAWERGADYPPVFVRWSTQEHLALFVRWLAEGRLRVRPLVTDVVTLAEAPEACHALMDDPGRHLGVVITY